MNKYFLLHFFLWLIPAALLAHMADSTTPFHSFLLKSLASCSPSFIPRKTLQKVFSDSICKLPLCLLGILLVWFPFYCHLLWYLTLRFLDDLWLCGCQLIFCFCYWYNYMSHSLNSSLSFAFVSFVYIMYSAPRSFWDHGCVNAYIFLPKTIQFHFVCE